MATDGFAMESMAGMMIDVFGRTVAQVALNRGVGVAES